MFCIDRGRNRRGEEGNADIEDPERVRRERALCSAMLQVEQSESAGVGRKQRIVFL